MRRLLLIYTLGILFVSTLTVFIISITFRSTIQKEVQKGLFANYEPLVVIIDSDKNLYKKIKSSLDPKWKNFKIIKKNELPTDKNILEELQTYGRSAFIEARGMSLIFTLHTSNEYITIFPLTSTIQRIRTPILIMLFIFVFCAAVLIGFIVLRPIIKRLKAIETSMERVKKGDLGVEISDQKMDAIGTLAVQMDAMVKRISNLLEAQQDLMGAISHELKTPLARIKFRLENLEKKFHDEERSELNSIEKEVDLLEAMIKDLLLFYKFDSNPPALKKEKINLSNLCLDIVDYFEADSSNTTITLDIDVDEDFSITGSLKFIELAIKNIVSNALSYAESKVIISLGSNIKMITLTVEDDGPGIPEEMRDSIFEPFVLVESGRDRTHGGTGLGLSIAKKIVESHHGKIDVGNSNLKGAAFTLSFPDTN